MSRNESHDPPEAGGQLLDELNTTQPIARAAFRDGLEQQLIARIYSESEAHMTPQVMTGEQVTTGRRAVLPLTLAAAMVCVMLAAGLLLAGRQPSPTGSAALLQPQGEATPEATPEVISYMPPDLRPVVVAATLIPRGSTLRADQLGIAYFPADLMPENGFTDVQSIVGWITQRDIVRWQPVTSSAVGQTLPRAQTSAAMIIPPDRVALAIPVERLGGTQVWLEEGVSLRIDATVDVDSLPPEIEIPEALRPGQAGSTTVRAITYDALVVYHGALGEQQVVTVAVREDEAALLAWSLENRVSLTFSASFGEEDVEQGIPTGYEIVDVPLDQLNSVPYGLQEGSRVDVIAALLYVDEVETQGEYQSLTLMAVGTPLPMTGESITPRLALQRIISGAVVAGFVTEAREGEAFNGLQLAVPRNAVNVLTWLVESQVPLMLIETCGCGG